MKSLYTFTLKIKDTEHEITLKQLGRRDREDFAVVYNAEYGKALSKGLSPFASLRKAALDSGGFWSENEVNYADGLVRKISETSNEIQKAASEEQDVTVLETTLRDLMEEFEGYKKPELELFGKSVEYEAEKNSIIWCVLNMSFVKRGEEYHSVFPGVSTESRLDYYYECADSEDKELEKKVFEKSYICYYHAVRNKETNKEVFDLLVKDDEPVNEPAPTES